MGGYGSGRYARESAKRTTDVLPSLDVREMKREGRIVPGQQEFIVREGVEIPLTWTPSGFSGGSAEDNAGGNYPRPWFVCPGVPGDGCSGTGRVAILYLEGLRLLCRSCLDLAYPSQRQGWTRLDKAKRRAEKARARLGVALDEEFVAKPKGMHHRTFVRLGRAYLRAHVEHVEAYNARAPKLLEQITRMGN